MACLRCSRDLVSSKDVSIGAHSDRAATSEPDSCIFCLSATGMQYVPLHFLGVDEMRSSSVREASVLPYSESLRSHCACRDCWESWEGRQISLRRQEPLCPACQRRLDLRRTYNEVLCHDCQSEVVLRTPSPTVLTKGHCVCCCCCTWPVVIVSAIFLNFFLVTLAWTFAGDLLVQHAVDMLESSTSMDKVLVPPSLQQAICPAIDVMQHLQMLTGDPFLRLVVTFVSNVCQTGSKRPARGKILEQARSLGVGTASSLAKAMAGAQHAEVAVGNGATRESGSSVREDGLAKVKVATETHVEGMILESPNDPSPGSGQLSQATGLIAGRDSEL
eukprot:TRINITY_DN49777_c0_g1_i1.p1 TRINITY_DN49777_c0_g1~~TRINITY_DN49777_c0_g1_i1.p1  ORF type:complete len:332 (+),score=20.66 TRINITY_DN49777_c0_g1_i1:54-1049(+)